MNDNELKRQALIKREAALADKFMGETMYNHFVSEMSGFEPPRNVVAIWLIGLDIPPARFNH